MGTISQTTEHEQSSKTKDDNLRHVLQLSFLNACLMEQDRGPRSYAVGFITEKAMNSIFETEDTDILYSFLSEAILIPEKVEHAIMTADMLYDEIFEEENRDPYIFTYDVRSKIFTYELTSHNYSN